MEKRMKETILENNGKRLFSSLEEEEEEEEEEGLLSLSSLVGGS